MHPFPLLLRAALFLAASTCMAAGSDISELGFTSMWEIYLLEAIVAAGCVWFARSSIRRGKEGRLVLLLPVLVLGVLFHYGAYLLGEPVYPVEVVTIYKNRKMVVGEQEHHDGTVSVDFPKGDGGPLRLRNLQQTGARIPGARVLFPDPRGYDPLCGHGLRPPPPR